MTYGPAGTSYAKAMARFSGLPDRCALWSLVRVVMACSLSTAGFVGAWWGASTSVATAMPMSYRPADTAKIGAALAKRPARPAIATGPNALQLLSQTAWVGPASDQFELHMKITAAKPAAEMLEVNIYGALTTRSQFWAALNGEFYGLYYQAGGGPLALDELPGDPNGGIDLDIPLNRPTGGLQLSATGVYPVQAFLEQDGVPMGKPLTTFIVYAGKDASTQRLNASLVMPFKANVPISPQGNPGTLSPGATATLQADSTDLARWPVPVTLQADVATVESLAGGDAAEQSAVTDLRKAVRSGDELLPATALPVDLQQLVGAGLTNDLRTELLSGDATLGKVLGDAPSATTWAFTGDLDSTSATVLAEMGVTQVAVPEEDLSALPLADEKFTFALPSKLSLGSGPDIVVAAADSELSKRLGQGTAPGQSVLVANQVLAELAMIDLETPNDVRGVVLMPPSHVALNPTLLSVLLAGLQSNPLVDAVPLEQLFRSVPLASAPTGGTMVRELEGRLKAVPPMGGVGKLQEAVADVSADGEVYGEDVPLVNGLSQRLFVSLSSAFSSAQRASMIGGVLESSSTALGKVRLPPSVSITLTSRQGRLPLTLKSTATSPIRVLLVLTSQQLSFVQATFSEGSCQPVNAGGGTRGPPVSEDCQLTLSSPTTILRVPVVVRAPGAFPLSLEVETPSGAKVLRASTDTVRSTAISDVGYILIGGAGLFLAVWWVRNARHGRRAKRLVPRPADDETDSVPAIEPDQPGGQVAGYEPGTGQGAEVSAGTEANGGQATPDARPEESVEKVGADVGAGHASYPGKPAGRLSH